MSEDKPSERISEEQVTELQAVFGRVFALGKPDWITVTHADWIVSALAELAAYRALGTPDDVRRMREALGMARSYMAEAVGDVVIEAEDGLIDADIAAMAKSDLARVDAALAPLDQARETPAKEKP